MGKEKAKILGLTGGIASGKSTAGRIFNELGIPIVDADAVSRELSSVGGRAHPLILEKFGTADRKRLREKVFKDSEAKKQLEQILHPLIVEESRKRLNLAKETHPEAPFLLYEASLLVETGRYREFDGLIVVDAPETVRKKRLIHRDGVPEKLADQMIRSQISPQERNHAADWVIENSGDFEELSAKIKEFVSHF